MSKQTASDVIAEALVDQRDDGQEPSELAVVRQFARQEANAVARALADAGYLIVRAHWECDCGRECPEPRTLPGCRAVLVTPNAP